MVPDWTLRRELRLGGGGGSSTLAWTHRLHRIGVNLALGATMQDRDNHHVRCDHGARVASCVWTNARQSQTG